MHIVTVRSSKNYRNDKNDANQKKKQIVLNNSNTEKNIQRADNGSNKTLNFKDQKRQECAKKYSLEYTRTKNYSRLLPFSIFHLSFITRTVHFFLLMSIPIFLILFITSLRIVSDESEDAITYQCAKHRNAAAWIATFKVKCAKHMFLKGSIHHLAYDEDVFTCIQNYMKRHLK